MVRPNGSSPLARGLRLSKLRDRGDLRIIPARAGFTVAAIIAEMARGDHPRSRGVYPARARSSSATSGSSPLARGLPEQVVRRPLPPRIIPARAGFTAP